MSSATNLPDEILLKIISYSSPSSVPQLVLTSRRLYECGNRELYRFVHHDGSRDESKEMRCRSYRICHPLCHSETSSRIIDIAGFLRTIRTSPLLRSFIKGACFQWDTSRASINSPRYHRIFDILAPSVKRLCLTPPNMDHLVGLPVVSLDIGSPGRHSWNDGSTFKTDEMYSLFLIPTLRQISIYRARRWWPPFLGNLEDQQRGTSSVESIFLHNTVPISRNLQALLSWPKALKYFHLETPAALENGSENYEMLSPKDIAAALRNQSATLEEFILVSRSGDMRIRPKTVFGSLQALAALKRLAVPRDYLVRSETEFGEYSKIRMSPGLGDGVTKAMATSLSQQFPPNLETICLQVDSFPWGESDTPRIQEWREWLHEIAFQKPVRHSALKYITIWSNPSAGAAPLHEALGCDVFEALERSEIELSYHETASWYEPFSEI
jgi:hypothetical protein